MIITDLLIFLLHHWLLVFFSTFLVYILFNKYNRGLNKYPGPPLAAYTNWWRFFDALGRDTQHTHIALHKKLGDIVRLGPDTLSFADPKAIKTIYGLNKGFVKSDFYPVQQGVAKGRRLPSLFSTVDEAYHARFKRCVNNAFAMTSLVSYEPLMNSTIMLFLDQTEKFFVETGDVCNFRQWLQFFAFDVIGEITWSKRLGFVEKNEDIDGIVAFVNWFLDYAGPVGQMPILDLIFEKNPIKMQLYRWGIFKKDFPATRFALNRSQERATEMAKIKKEGLPKDKSGIDFLSRFTQAQHDHPDFMTDAVVLTATLSMVFAGSETTAISLASVFYFLVKHPECYTKLIDELDEAIRNGTIVNREDGVITWPEAQTLSYLDAVIQESFRMHPAAGLPLERIVPKQGITICDEFIPGGTIVGCNAWVLHRRPEIFGEDVDVFRPERWLESSPEKLKEMKATMFQFGAGPRTCIGKNISLLEIYKLVPSFLRRFEIELEHPEKPWRTFNSWFVRQYDFDVKFKRRKIHATV